VSADSRCLGGSQSWAKYSRAGGSGTEVFFQEHVLGKKDYAQTMNQMNGNAQIREAVVKDASGTGTSLLFMPFLAAEGRKGKRCKDAPPAPLPPPASLGRSGRGCRSICEEQRKAVSVH